MARYTDDGEKPGKHKIYEVIVQSLSPKKGGGWNVRYEDVIKYPGADEFFKRLEE